jgi:hypothetical protein
LHVHLNGSILNSTEEEEELDEKIV